MADNFLKRPFRFSNILSHQNLDKASLGQSIAKNIELIIFTRKGEHRFNPNFGCEIWDLDFELMVSEGLWEEMLRKSLTNSIAEYEKRIVNVEVDVKITEVEKFFSVRKVAEIKKKVNVYVEGRMRYTNERFSFSKSLFLSPLSC